MDDCGKSRRNHNAGMRARQGKVAMWDSRTERTKKGLWKGNKEGGFCRGRDISVRERRRGKVRVMMMVVVVVKKVVMMILILASDGNKARA